MAQDFRSWLGGKDKYAVQFTGNDGRIDPTKKGYDTMKGSYLNTGGNRNTVQSYVTNLYNQYNNEKNSTAANNHNAFISSINAQTAAIRAQTAAAPKLPTFDILGNYNSAKTRAQQNQQGYYDRLWNDKITQWNAQRGAKESTKNLNLETNAMTNRLTKEDNATTRARTAEDVAGAIQQINEGETNWQQDEGTQFDQERNALMEAVAGAGLTTSGLGANQVGTATDQRNITSERQVGEFNVQRQAKELFKNRTFEDMARGDLRADEKRVIEDKSVNLDFENYLAELAAEQTASRTNWEADLAGAVADETARLDAEGRMGFIAGLAGQGWRAQDIALAQQVYGK